LGEIKILGGAPMKLARNSEVAEKLEAESEGAKTIGRDDFSIKL